MCEFYSRDTDLTNLSAGSEYWCSNKRKQHGQETAAHRGYLSPYSHSLESIYTIDVAL